MKKLTLLYRKSKSNNLNSTQKKALASIVAIGCFLIVGCAMKFSESSETSQKLDSVDEKSADKENKENKEKERINIYVKMGENRHLAALLDPKSCGSTNSSDKKQHWTFPIASPYGDYRIDLSIPNLFGTEKIEVHLDGQNYLLNLSQLKTQPNIEDVCKQWDEHPSNVIVQASYFDSFAKTVLNSVSSSCDFSVLGENGWQCKLSKSTPDYVEKTVSAIQKKIIQKWSRQPYLYTRRLTVTKNFAAAMKNSSEQAATKLCSILANSIETEIPLVMANQRWQKAVCHSNLKGEVLTEVLSHGLHLALQELEFLFQEAEKTSRVGLLQVRIPRELTNSKNIWISLQPVNEQLDPSSLANNVATNEVFNQQEQVNACWHPVFSSDRNMSKNANLLGLVVQAAQDKCITVIAENKANETEQNYVDKSIIGETEFLIENFNSKVLRLPVGDYKYKAYELPVNAAEWQPSEVSPKSEGTISWRTNRPRVLINSW